MSKAKQRKISAFNSGREDARRGLPFRWRRHPNLEDYRRGYRSIVFKGKKLYPARTWFQRLFKPWTLDY